MLSELFAIKALLAQWWGTSINSWNLHQHRSEKLATLCY